MTAPKKLRPVQYFSKEYLEHCKSISTEEILNFLESFRRLHGEPDLTEKKVKSRLISIKIPEPLLEAFRAQSALVNIPYQTQIKILMQEWLAPRAGLKKAKIQKSKF